MYPYIPNTEHEVNEMLQELGLKSVEDLFADIPRDIYLKDGLKLDKAKSELEVKAKLSKLAAKNMSADTAPCFLGAGSYDHYIPSVIPQVMARAEFLTSYTPYQPEISQGTLQYIFEFQSLMSRLTGLEISNASLYDGPTAVVEAALMAASSTRREKILVSKAIHPDSMACLKTYCHNMHYEVIEAELDGGATSLDDIKAKLSEEIACVVIQSPNFYGIIEDVETLVAATHDIKKTAFILSTDPVSLGLLKKPGDMGVDICVGDAQGFGIAMAFGGPSLGYITCTKEYLRKIPGRLVGETTDRDGKKCYVLTLTAREQHIRREKASSNICSNQGINCLAATMYLSLMGKEGLREVAVQCHSKAKYLRDKLISSGLFKEIHNKPFFMEFALKTDLDNAKIEKAMLDNGIIGPLNLGKICSCNNGVYLFAVSEKRTKEEIDRLVSVLEGLK